MNDSKLKKTKPKAWKSSKRIHKFFFQQLKNNMKTLKCYKIVNKILYKKAFQEKRGTNGQ